MLLIKPRIEFLDMNQKGLKLIEQAGRTCYKSEEKITETSHIDFVRKLKKAGHHAMLEFGWLCYRIVCDRGVTHEIVRHRLFSYAQESTRYCNYKGGLTFIIPPWTTFPEGEYEDWIRGFGFEEQTNEAIEWHNAMIEASKYYSVLIDKGWSPQQARSVLPNSIKTEIVIGGNLREWMHFFDLRRAKAAHPQMREVAELLYSDVQARIPVLFENEKVI
jgi:thymidylate synthase (FAD)